MRQILSILMENEAGALSNMIGLFSQRALNIESLTVVPTVDRTLSQVTLNTISDQRTISHIAKQVNKLIDVVSVTVLTDSNFRKLMGDELEEAPAQVSSVRPQGISSVNYS